MKKLILLSMAVAFFASSTYAQWKTYGPYGGDVQSLSGSGSNLFAGTNSGGVTVSTNNGYDWSLPENEISNNTAIALATSGNKTFAGTYSGYVYLSTDNGNSWTLADGGLPPGTTSGHPDIKALVTDGNYVYSGTNERGVFVSSNNGTSWQQVNTGLADTAIYSLAINGPTVYAGTSSGIVYSSANNGTTWVEVKSGLPGSVNAIAASGAVILAGSGYGRVYYSKDNGVTWDFGSSGLSGAQVHTMVIDGPRIFAAAVGGVYVSTDTGETWTVMNNGLTSLVISSLVKNSTGLYAGTMGGGVFLSTDNAATWAPVVFGMASVSVSSLAATGGSVFAGASTSGIYLSGNNGNSWSLSGLTNWDINTVTVNGPKVFASSLASRPYLSTDNGVTWEPRNTGLDQQVGITCYVTSGDKIYAGTYGSGLAVSANNGQSWTMATNTGFPTHLGSKNIINAMVKKGNTIFAGSKNYGSNTTPVAVCKTTDEGATWTRADSGITPTGISTPDVLSLLVSGNRIFAGTSFGDVFVTTNDGATWTEVSTGLPSFIDIYALAATGSYVFAGTDSGVYVTANNGANWTPVRDGLPTRWRVTSLAINSTHIFAGLINNSVWQRPLSEVVSCSAGFTVYPDTAMAHHWFVQNLATGAGTINYSWNWGDGSAPGTGAAPSHVYSDSAYYSICLTITDGNGCNSTYCDSATYIRSSRDAMISVTVIADGTTGVEDIESENKVSSVSVYPNPVGNQLVIEAVNFQPDRVYIYDVNGKKVADQTYTRQINVSALAKGLYFLEVKKENTTRRTKFVKL